MLNVENNFPDQFHDCPSLNKRKIRDSRRLLTQKVSLITADEALKAETRTVDMQIAFWNMYSDLAIWIAV